MIMIRENGLAAYFEVNEKGNLNFYGIREETQDPPAPLEKEKSAYEPLEIKTTGATTRSERGGKALGFLCPDLPQYISHEDKEAPLGKQYTFHLRSSALDISLHYLFVKGTKTVRTWTEVENISDTDVGLEYISSFALMGVADRRTEGMEENDRLMIPHNSWCREFNWTDNSLAELGYHPHQAHSTFRILAANTGSWSTKEYLPMGCFYSATQKEAMLWQIESNTSWSWEISDSGALLYLRLAGPSESENGWWKRLAPGESFESVKAAIAFGEDFNGALAEMTAYRRRIAHRVASDRHHPVIFNDYMGCLQANPTTEKLLPQIDAAAAAGCEIFCIDAGWYADQSGWWGTIGTYEESPERFPNGFREVFDYIRSKGMRPGLWVEPEDIGTANETAKQFDDGCFFTRHGVRVVERDRYQFDMRNENVRAHLTALIDRLVSDYGLEYFKFDYNIDAGVGTEQSADSYGDGLYEHGLALVSWIDELQAKYPDLIIENCSSGGMRMDYVQLQHYSLQSLTDAWENRFLVQIAAASPTGVLPEQACVWSVPRVEFSLDQIASCMVNTMLRRIHLSGKTAFLNEEQRAILHEGVRIYKETRHLIDRLIPFYPCGAPNETAGAIQTVGFRDEDHCFLTVTNRGEEQEINLPLSFTPNSVEILYPSLPCTCRTEGNAIVLTLRKDQAVFLRVL